MSGRFQLRDIAIAVYVPTLVVAAFWYLSPELPGWALLGALAVAATISVAGLHVFRLRFVEDLAQTIEDLSYDRGRRRQETETSLPTPLATALRRLAQHTGSQQAQLFQARDQALKSAENERRSVRQQSAFMAQVSHEIRTPTTAILGYSEVMLDVNTRNEDRIAHARTIKSSSEHLLTLLNDLLDLAKVEAGRMTVERVSCSPHTIVSDAVAMLDERARAKGITLTVEYPEPIPQTILSDPTRLKQILVNLISNAIKFTEVGGVRVKTRLRRGADRKHRLIFEVHDSGIGMSREETALLFQPFTQARGDIARKFGGTGLGLCIARQLANLLGGTIEVRSEKGCGTAFTVSVETGPIVDVPLIVAEPPQAPTIEEPGRPLLLGGRVLVAEDVRDVRNLIQITLSACSSEVTPVENGQQALAKMIEATRLGTPYDVVLMDLHMPQKNGDEAVREARAAGYSGPIVALTAHAAGEDFDQLMSAGCNDYFNKPFHRDALIRFLAKYLPGTETQRPAKRPPLPITQSTPPPPTPQVAPPPPAAVGRAGEQEPLPSAFANEPDMAGLIQEFLRIIPSQIESLESALAESNLDELAALAHQLKGTAGTFGYDVISEVATELERATQERAPSEELEEHATSLLSLLERALLMLEVA